MEGDYSQDTIAAIATPVGEGGIGVLRLSGPKGPDAVQALWRGSPDLDSMESHRLYLGHLVHPETQAQLDRVLVVRMRAPRSYTGEEVVEIHAHGGPLLLANILQALLTQGLRPADPGEFTRRAFLNNKMDLLQAEAVAELIHAKGEAALHNAQAQLQGRLSGKIAHARDALLRNCAQIEAAIDFPEEDLEWISGDQLSLELGNLERELETWLEKFHTGRLLREGLRIALVGRPNVGKSSLLNRLLNEERAIVHESPGTTRDLVEGWVQWEGVPVQLFDTAGIREAADAVEQEGVRRSRRAAESADLVLWVLDASQELSPDDLEIGQWISGKIITVANKTDLSPSPSWSSRDLSRNEAPLLVSARHGLGIAELKAEILNKVGLQGLREKEFAYLNNARHQDALRQGLEAIRRARRALFDKVPLELPAADLRTASQAMEALLGKVHSEDILGEIFSHFCIGK